MVGAAGVDVEGEEALAGGDEEAVTFGAAEAEVAGGFGEFDKTDAFAFGIEDVDAVEAWACPPTTCPDVTIHIASNAV